MQTVAVLLAFVAVASAGGLTGYSTGNYVQHAHTVSAIAAPAYATQAYAAPVAHAVAAPAYAQAYAPAYAQAIGPIAAPVVRAAPIAQYAAAPAYAAAIPAVRQVAVAQPLLRAAVGPAYASPVAHAIAGPAYSAPVQYASSYGHAIAAGPAYAGYGGAIAGYNGLGYGYNGLNGYGYGAGLASPALLG